MVKPSVFRVARRRDGGWVYNWFRGETDETDARQLHNETRQQGSRLEKLNRETGVWESSDDEQ